MINKVVIFAAGRGTRMKGLAKDRPKHLIEIFGRPFLYFLLTNLTKAGYKEIIMVTGHLSEQMNDFMDDYRQQFPFFQTVNQFDILGDEKYGTLMPLLVVREQVSNEDFVVVMGDNLYSLDDLKGFSALDDKYCYIGGFKAADPSQYGTLIMGDDNKLVRIDEKVPEPVSDVINAGIYKFTSAIYNVASGISKAANGEYQITDAISGLAKEGKVKVKTLKDYWLDFGRPEDISKIEKFIESNNLFETYGIKR